MNLYIHNVGREGADRDFPKTVFGDVSLGAITAQLPTMLRAHATNVLATAFPAGTCNCWGVPEGAGAVIRNLKVGDAILLMRTTAGEGEIPAMGVVAAYWSELMRDLSRMLWSESKFPYVFFFTTRRIELSWRELKSDVGYAANYRLPPHFVRVADAEDRLATFGGVRGYIQRLVGYQGLGTETPKRLAESTPEVEYAEGKRLVRERQYFMRNPHLVRAAKEHYGVVCQACGFDFGAKYGQIGHGYIECHHLNPLSERDDETELSATTLAEVTVLCSNCHRMVHRHRPALSLDEIRASLTHRA